MFNQVYKLFSQYLTDKGILSPKYYVSGDTGATYPYITLVHSRLPLPSNSHNTKNNGRIVNDRYLIVIRVVGSNDDRVAVVNLVGELIPLLNNASYEVGNISDIDTIASFRPGQTGNEFYLTGQVTCIIIDNT